MLYLFFNDNSFEGRLLKNLSLINGVFVLFSHAPWCPACRALVTTWDSLSQSADELGITVGKIDVTRSPALSGRFFVTALPTIFQ